MTTELWDKFSEYEEGAILWSGAIVRDSSGTQYAILSRRNPTYMDDYYDALVVHQPSQDSPYPVGRRIAISVADREDFLVRRIPH